MYVFLYVRSTTRHGERCAVEARHGDARGGALVSSVGVRARA